MGNLTLLDEEILEVLKKIEYCCENAELCYPESIKKQKAIEVIYPDNHSNLERALMVNRIEKYFLKKGINFESTYNLVDDESKDYIKLGIIRGESIVDIRKQILHLINELKSKGGTRNIDITYNINIGRFTFNNKDIVVVEGKQKDVSDYLINAGENIKASWDEIHETFKDFAEEDTTNQTKIEANKRSIRTAVNEINKHTEKYLEIGRAHV